MIGFQTKQLSFIAALGLFFLVGKIAIAQEVEDLAPPPGPTAQGDEDGGEEATDAPIDLIGGGFFEEDEPASDPSMQSLPSLPGAANSVDVGLLGAVNQSVIGLIDVAEGGFGEHMWAGSRRRVVEDLIPQLPERAQSPIMRQLVYRLLLSKARAPEGQQEGKSLLALRLAKLYGAGFIDQARELSGQDLSQSGDPDVLAVRAKIDLLNEDPNSACASAARTRNQSGDAYWLKLRAFCYVLVGDKDAARFSADLLLEEGHDDPAFFGLLSQAIDNIELETLEIEGASPLHLALLRLNELGLPAGSIESAELAVQLRVANTGMAGGAPADLMTARLPAAEFATLSRALEGRKLAILYRNVPFLQSEIESLVGNIYEAPSAEARAALFQSVEGTQAPNMRASGAKKALDVARLSGTYGIAVQVYGPVIGELTPQDSLAPFALDFAPALYGIGHYEQGAEWLELALAQEALNASSGVAKSSRLRTYEILRYIRNLPNEEMLVLWDPIERLMGASDDASYALAAHEVRLLEALGVGLPAEARQLLLARPMQTEGQMPATGVLSGLDAAARSGKVAETVLYALIALGEEGPQGAPTPVVERVVAALARSGLFIEAQSVAIESLLGRAL